MTITDLQELEFISYGIVFDESKFNPAVDSARMQYLNKPSGGLWASPVNAEFGWKDWCIAEDFKGDEYFKIHTKFKLTEKSKVVVIDSKWDLVELLREYGKKDGKLFLSEVYLDYEKLIEDFDGIYLTRQGNRECHLFMSSLGVDFNPSDLNSWDVESIVVFRKENLDITEIKG